MSDYRFEKLAADTIRVISAEAIQKAKSGHPGMPMGCADFAFSLFYKYLKHNPRNANWIGRDRFVLSKGHAAPSYYGALALRGYFNENEIRKLRSIDSFLQGHPDMQKVPGVDMSTGSLGQGLSAANGMALYAKRSNKNYHTHQCRLSPTSRRFFHSAYTAPD